MSFSPSLTTVANLNRQLKELNLSPAQVWQQAVLTFENYLYENPEQNQELVGKYRDEPDIMVAELELLKPKQALLMVLEADPYFSLNQMDNDQNDRLTFLSIIQMINQFIL